LGITQEVQYPPEEIFNPPRPVKKNFNHIILWMLQYNKECEWSDFTEEPIEISPSTLSTKLNRLINNNQIEKVTIEKEDRKKNVYRITTKGKEKFFQLVKAKHSEKRLNFPPEVILNKRNYDHWILWMLYNNESCKWSDFREPPLSINQSSLSKNLNLLLDDTFINKDYKNNEYTITSPGKEKYHEILKKYDLDSQSILEEEIKRVELITQRTLRFFEKFKVIDNEIKFRFINYNLSLPFEKVRNSIDKVDDFYKVLLFLSINHPNNYPNSSTAQEFAQKYQIDKVILDFHILRITEKEIYPVKFFKIQTEENKEYYFYADGRIEKILKATTEEHIRKFTYLNKLQTGSIEENPILNKKNTIKAILEDVCGTIFNIELKKSLKEFLPTYIDHLMYKFKTELKSMDLTTKMDSYVFNQFQQASHSSGSRLAYFIDNQIVKLLESYLSPEIKQLSNELQLFTKKKDYQQVLKKLDDEIKIRKDDLDYYIYKALIFCLDDKPGQSIQLLNSEISEKLDISEENTYLIYNFTLAYSYMALKKFKEAYQIARKVIQEYPESSISYLIEALVLGYNNVFKFLQLEVKEDKALRDFDDAFSFEADKSNKARILRLKSIILQNMGRLEDSLETIETAITNDDSLLELYYTKMHQFISMEQPDKALNVIEQILIKFPEEDKYINLKKAHIFKKQNEIEKGLKLIKESVERYPDDYEFLNQLAYFFKYAGKKDDAIETMDKLLKVVPDDGNYWDSYGEILLEFKEYEKAIEKCEKALEIDPNGWFSFNSNLTLGIVYYKLKNYEKAIEYLTEAKGISKTAVCCIDSRHYIEEKYDYYMEKIKNSRE